MMLKGTILLQDKKNKKKFSLNTGKKEVKSLSSKDIDIYLVGNITEDLLNKDSKYKINNQCKLILERYSEKGESFIKDLEGYFLIIIDDKQKDKVCIFNNRYSNCLLYYRVSKKKLEFSGNIKSLLKKSKKNPNMKTINLFLNSGYSYSDCSFIKGINRLIPGHYIKAEKGNISLHKYSSMKFKRKKIQDLKKAQKEYENIWKEAIKRFAINNNTKNIGCLLSGGIDTSWVVLNASKAHNKPIHTYTGNYDFSLFNESNKAAFVTKRCKGTHHKITITEKDLDLLPEMIRACEEPVLASSLSIYKIMKIAKKDTDTFLTGDGGNNIYNHLYPVCEIHKYIRFFPHWIRKFTYDFVSWLAEKTGWERLWELKYPLHAFSKKDIYEDFYKNLTCYRHFSKKERESLLKKGFYKEPKEKDMLGVKKIRKDSFADDLIEARFMQGSIQYVSTFHEEFAKSLGMKLFPPYQNKKIIDFLCSLPFEQMNKGNTFQLLTNKAYRMPFQKKLLAKYFSRKFVDKAGQPFDQPFHYWLEKRPRIVRLLFRRLKKRGWYEDDYLDKLYKEHKKQSQHKKIYCQLSNHGYRIMALLSLEIWCMEFLDKNDNNRKKAKSIEEYLDFQ